MPRRRYDSRTRQDQVLDRQQLVAAAAAELHAEKGVIATSYADIAQRAGVSLPTVRTYFPTQTDIVTACTGHVIAHAPVLPAAEILDSPDLNEAIARLVAAMDRIHAYFQPWACWRQEPLVPYLAQLSATNRQQLTDLAAQILARHGKLRASTSAAVWESLLSFDIWQRLVREHGLPRSLVRATLTKLLMAALGPEPSITVRSGPRRRS